MDPAIDEFGAEEGWTEPRDRILARLAAIATGLDVTAVQSWLKTFGPNAAAVVRRSPLWLQFLSRFRNPLMIILLVASGLSALTGDVSSFAIVVTIVMMSMTIDFVQEVRAQNAVEALRRLVAVQATVRRDGASISVPIDQLVPGDIVELIAGDIVNVSKFVRMASISNFGNMFSMAGAALILSFLRCSRSRFCSTTCFTTSRRLRSLLIKSMKRRSPGR